MENKKLREIFEHFTEMSDKIIEDKNRGGIMPVCIIIQEDKADVIGFPFGSYEEKRMAREFLFKAILNQKTKAYILIQDAKMTCVQKSDLGKGGEVKDVVMRSLYSPNFKIKEFAIYNEDERKIISKEKIFDSEEKDGMVDKEKPLKMVDEWDLWGLCWDKEDNPQYKEVQEWYEKWKRDNADKFSGLNEDGSPKSAGEKNDKAK